MNTTLIKADVVNSSLSAVVNNEVADTVQDETIIQEFGKNGKLTNAQKALLLAAKVKAQAREMQLVDELHRREIGLLARIWKFTGGPVVKLPHAHAEKEPNERESEDNQTGWKSLFTLRNVVGGGAVLIVGFGFLLTNLTHNYKEKADNYERDIKALAEENRKLEGDAQRERTRAESAERALGSVQGAGAEVNQKLLATIDSLSKERGEAARATAAGAEKTYQKLYESEKKERQDAQKRHDELLKRNEKLVEENAALKATQVAKS